MANLYFNGAVDSDWNTLGNWWTDEAYTTPATSLPTSIDNVFINPTNTITITNSGSTPTVNNLTFNPPSSGGSGSTIFDMSIDVNGIATFGGSGGSQSHYGSSSSPGPTLNGNVNFIGLVVADNCTINGNVSFANSYSSINANTLCTINGNVTVTNDVDFATSVNFVINGNITIDSTSSFPYTNGTVNGDVTINGGGGGSTLSGVSVNGTVILNNSTVSANDYLYGNNTIIVQNNSSYGAIPNEGTTILVYDTSEINSDAEFQSENITVILHDDARIDLNESNPYIIFYAAPTIIFKDNSYNQLGITGTVTTNYGRGINDSDILGLP